jgi:hypothetical protein
VLLCVLVVRSVLHPATDPVRAAAPRDTDPDWPAVPALGAGAEAAGVAGSHRAVSA